eukprot:scaffold86399_cov74-Phaeocystis_antarctica.AAC.3
MRDAACQILAGGRTLRLRQRTLRGTVKGLDHLIVENIGLVLPRVFLRAVSRPAHEELALVAPPGPRSEQGLDRIDCSLPVGLNRVGLTYKSVLWPLHRQACCWEGGHL